jgi:hypothetical protein
MFRARGQSNLGASSESDHRHSGPKPSTTGKSRNALRSAQIAVESICSAADHFVQNVLVVGGFGASEYLFQQIKLHVPPQFQNKVVRPMDSVAAIVKGAVTAGITERVITSRVARRHYLMATLQPFKEGHHPEQYRVPSLDGKDRCKYTRQIFVQKGQRVKIGEPVKVSFFRQVAPGATLMYEDVLYACDEDVCPEYTKDPRESFSSPSLLPSILSLFPKTFQSEI